ncbi:hypothetical protein L6452_40963 [Arctium lappa]|uniref:Uncharacterized protein n=1 Tax=Arctium lappa TaxID=4217 RepID=A0ACB8XNW1_ARCLA|nr:hypothetical protein L6452_40963 [Arctium lappa]
MIKRRFYKQEHGDKDAASGSSSSSDSELDAEASVDTEEEEDDNDNNMMVMESRKKDQPCSSSSGYESEDSSGNEVNLDASGRPTNNDGSEGENDEQDVIDTRVSADNHSDKNAITNGVLDCVLKSKSVFKCKLCPRIVCLTEETLNAHLKSKRHARSEKLLKEGRLKMMLNSDGEIEEEEDGETHQERHAATLALAQSNKNAAQGSKKNKGRQRQRKRLRKKTSDDSVAKKSKKSAKMRAKSDIKQE